MALQLPVTKDAATLRARALFERALGISNADNAAARSRATLYTYLQDFIYGWTDPQIDYDSKIIGQADRARLRSPPITGWPMTAKCSYLSTFAPREREALGCADSGLAVNPNSRPALRDARPRRNCPRPLRTSKSPIYGKRCSSVRAIRKMGIFHLNLGSPELEQGHYDAAIDEFHKALDAGWRVYMPYGNLAAAYALEGKMDEAKAALAEARRLNPSLTTVKWYIANSPPVPKAIEGLRKAGLPEE